MKPAEERAYSHPGHMAEYIGLDSWGRPIKNKKFHWDIYNLLLETQPRKSQTKQTAVILAPRNHGKSTCVVNYAAWCLGRNRDMRIVIASATEDLAREWLRQIVSIFPAEEFKSTFGNLLPSRSENLVWNDTEKVVSGRSPYARHLSLLASAVGSNILGKRADIIICDDIVTIHNSATQHLREQLRSWFWEVLWPILDPGGQIVVLGTRFYREDLYAELMRKWKDNVLVIRAEDKDGNPIWPERFSREALEHERKSMGSIFYNAQYLNDPQDISGNFLRREWLHFKVAIPDSMEYFAGMDPCVTARKGDYGVIATIGRDENGQHYLVDIHRMQGGMTQQIEALKELNKRYRYRAIHIEANAAQAFITQFLSENTDLPIRASNSSLPKNIRIANMATNFEFGRVLLAGMIGENGIEPIPQLVPFVDEWCNFPDGDHDDTLDAVEKAIEATDINRSEPIQVTLDTQPHFSRSFRVLNREFGARRRIRIWR